MIALDDTGRCRSCCWWTEGAPPIATAQRHAAPKEDIGICERHPPTCLVQVGMPVTLYPETHADRGCGEWEPDDDSDDPDRDECDVVVPFQARAA